MKSNLEALSDEELMEIVSNGNLDAMTHIFNRYKLRLYNFFYQMVQDRVICEELTQNTFYKVINYKQSYKGGKFVSWIFKIARNNFYDYYKNNKKRQPLEPLEFALESINESTIEKNEEKMHLMSVLNTLNDKDRELIIMNRLQNMKYNEIAEITGSNTVAVRARVHRIIKKIRIQYFKTI